jgi:hypothetical protein
MAVVRGKHYGAAMKVTTVRQNCPYHNGNYCEVKFMVPSYTICPNNWETNGGYHYTSNY